VGRQSWAEVDAAVASAVQDGVPGVVAVVTDRDGIVYDGCAGVRSIADEQPMTLDTVFAIFSTTKALTATVALQLVESGDLDLAAPASRYAPALGEIAVLEGFAEDGRPQLRPPKVPVSTHHLLVHTAGFGYDFFDPSYARLARDHGQPSIIAATPAALRTPLLFEPGTQWTYGSNLDWVGQVIEGITGARLGEVMTARLLEPLGMHDTGFTLRPDQVARRAGMHRRKDGGLSATGSALPADPEVDMGGHGLYSTAGDYARFLRMWLRDGELDGVRILRPQTVAMALENHLGDLSVSMLPGVIPALSHDAEFFPGIRKTWSYLHQRNEEQAPTGRPAGEGGWAGLANLYYWLDRSSGLAGYWAAQVFPYFDPTCLRAYLALETAVYRGWQQ
jgi:methyl acetate hydrolase